MKVKTISQLCMVTALGLGLYGVTHFDMQQIVPRWYVAMWGLLGLAFVFGVYFGSVADE